ncbi:hypothetical protein [Natrarchaeobaculum sulfurireducens]|uniref:hypothetical protein n=1 Tax=Natrarchaeobaculum sulfurireducens TaxID=2044521 RepID=UPI00105AB0D5|nr:hypothetical protein [Natrarchaeobaculum sulfurireducens]
MGSNLQSKVFEDRSVEGFELAFTAVLCTIILMTPRPSEIPEYHVNGVIFILLLVVMIRRMATITEYRSSTSIISLTQRVVELAAIWALIYSFSSISVRLNISPEYFYFTILLFPILIIFAHEYLFRDFFIYFAAKSYDFYADTNAKWAADLCYFSLLLFRGKLPERLIKLQWFQAHYQQKQKPNQTHLGIVSIVGVLALISLPAAFLYYFIGSPISTAIMVILFVIYVRIIVRFWYLGYGLTEKLSSRISYWLTDILLYSILVLFLFTPLD